MKRYFTSESVTEGHPDKICDKIADSILDDILSKDKNARVACEVFVTTGLVNIMGEITSNSSYDVVSVARKVINEIGYNDCALGFEGNSCGVVTSIKEQSPDISMGVDTGGAGDQGIMFGYANSDTPELMPLPIFLSHKLCKRLADARKNGELPYLRPDGKAQVTVEYCDGVAKRVDAVVVSAQHSSKVTQTQLRSDIEKYVIRDVISSDLIDENTRFFINPTGNFEIGGPMGDTGLTGRKIIVDTYGGFAPHGGGSFSGKDPTKVDRSASYMARYVAKNIVKSGICRECLIEFAYAIGVEQPVSVTVDTKGTGLITDERIEEIVKKEFDLSPRGIIGKLDLLEPVYARTTNYGHFGREEFTWEQTDKAEALAKYLFDTSK